jgi:hypothetical protein
MEYTSIYGYIKIDREYLKSIETIKNIGRDKNYPYISTNMFSLGDDGFYYENIFIGFATTYKYFGLDLIDWNEFILKMEGILRNIDFENAQFHVNSAVGNYTLFWTRKGPSLLGEENARKYIEGKKLIKTNEWYFGFGERDPFTGSLLRSLEGYEDLRNLTYLGFKYPIPQDKNVR